MPRVHWYQLVYSPSAEADLERAPLSTAIAIRQRAMNFAVAAGTLELDAREASTRVEGWRVSFSLDARNRLLTVRRIETPEAAAQGLRRPGDGAAE